MPTGYTADVKLDTPFPEFAMRCARAFGAFIMMRDDSLDTPAPDKFESSDHHAKGLAEAQERLARLKAMTPAERTAEFEAHQRAAKERYQEDLRKRDELKAAYERMLSFAHKWRPPTPEHQGLKDFMHQQLVTSIDFDCSVPEERWYEIHPDEESWFQKEISRAQWNINYHTEGVKEEAERTAGRNEWIGALRDSLGIFRVEVRVLSRHDDAIDGLYKDGETVYKGWDTEEAHTILLDLAYAGYNVEARIP